MFFYLNNRLFFPLEPDTVFCEKWLKINGTKIEDLTSDSRFPNSATESKYISRFKQHAPNSKYFGGRYRSYLLAQQTGNYTFYTFCDDSCRLFLSSDVNPRNKRQIVDQNNNVAKADENNCCRYDYLVWYQSYKNSIAVVF